jgi:hypothetical protein
MRQAPLDQAPDLGEPVFLAQAPQRYRPRRSRRPGLLRRWLARLAQLGRLLHQEPPPRAMKLY